MQTKSYSGQLWIRTRKYIPRVILYTVAAGFAVAFAIAMSKDPESEGKLAQLRQMAAETSLPPGFQKRHTSESNKRGRAMLVIRYYSPAGYEEVKGFYSTLLVAKGWETPVEKSSASLLGLGSVTRSLTFRSGEFLIVISEEESSQFSFIYRWERK